MIHVRRSTSRGFTQVANGVLRDPGLSLKARGLLVQLLSHEDGWQQSVAYCARECRDGRDSIKAAFRELEDAGYAQRRRRKGPGGKWLWDITVSDERILVGSPSTPFPSMENPSTEKASIDEEALGEEPLDEEPQELNLERERFAQARNPLFDALAEATGRDPRAMTSREARACGVALSEIKAATPDVTIDELHRRATNYPTHFDGAALTPNALANQWSKCRDPSPQRGRRQSVAEEWLREQETADG